MFFLTTDNFLQKNTAAFSNLAQVTWYSIDVNCLMSFCWKIHKVLLRFLCFLLLFYFNFVFLSRYANYSTVLHVKGSVSTLIFEVKFEGQKNVSNYYTRVNTGTKIKKTTTSLLISFFHYWSNTPITNCKVCWLRRPQVCACSNKQTLDFVFISPSRTPRQHFMPNELLLFTYRLPQTSQQNQKTPSTKSRQDTFLM